MFEKGQATTAYLDENPRLLRFTPRKPASQWSASNKERVARLTHDGRMAPAGLAAVAVAKARGTWDELTSLAADTTPPDLAGRFAGSARLTAPRSRAT